MNFGAQSAQKSVRIGNPWKDTSDTSIGKLVSVHIAKHMKFQVLKVKFIDFLFLVPCDIPVSEQKPSRYTNAVELGNGRFARGPFIIETVNNDHFKCLTCSKIGYNLGRLLHHIGRIHFRGKSQFFMETILQSPIAHFVLFCRTSGTHSTPCTPEKINQSSASFSGSVWLLWLFNSVRFFSRKIYLLHLRCPECPKKRNSNSYTSCTHESGGSLIENQREKETPTKSR